MGRTRQNFFNGQRVDTTSEKTLENRHPERWDEVLGRIPDAGGEDVNETSAGIGRLYSRCSREDKNS